MTISKAQFAKLMEYPSEWLEWGLYPDDLFEGQQEAYSPGEEQASEHYRNGAFHWWLRSEPTREILRKLIALTFLDPDPAMADDVRGYIRQQAAGDGELLELLDERAK